MEELEQQLAAIAREQKAYIEQNYVKTDQGGYWIRKSISLDLEQIIPCTDDEIAVHQAHIRKLKQRASNLQQEAIIKTFKGIPGGIKPPAELAAAYNEVFPLVARRADLNTVKTILQLEPKEDGELFSFTEPIDVKIVTKFCNCGQFPLAPEKMTDEELAAANSHLEVCQYIREEVTVGKSQVFKHKVGHRDCHSCYKTPVSNGVGGIEAKSNVSWCPRFLRPFRNLSPIAYAEEIHLQRSCYAGLLHHQISVEIIDDVQYIVKESMCDTCGYSTKDEQQIVQQEDKI